MQAGKGVCLCAKSALRHNPVFHAESVLHPLVVFALAGKENIFTVDVSHVTVICRVTFHSAPPFTKCLLNALSGGWIKGYVLDLL